MNHFNNSKTIFQRLVSPTGSSEASIMKQDSSSILTQYLHETHQWERALDYYRQENSYLKTWLSELVDNHSGEVFVAMAEYYNNRFLAADDHIKVFVQDLKLQSRQIAQLQHSKLNAGLKLNNRQLQLRKEMEFFEKDMTRLRVEFTSKMLNYLDLA